MASRSLGIEDLAFSAAKVAAAGVLVASGIEFIFGLGNVADAIGTGKQILPTTLEGQNPPPALEQKISNDVNNLKSELPVGGAGIVAGTVIFLGSSRLRRR